MTADHDDHDHAHPGLTVTVERTGPCSASVTFSVSAAEYEKNRHLGLRRVASRTRMKGFRPGKAPEHVLEKAFGSEVDKDLVQHFLNHAYDRAVHEHELRPAAHPRVEIEAIQRTPGADLAHTFTILLRPTIAVLEVKGVTVTTRGVQVSDEEVDRTVQELRRQNSHTEPAGEPGLAEDGMALAKLSFHAPSGHAPSGGAPLLERANLRVGPATAPNGIEPAAWKAALLGARSGETREVEITYPTDFPKPEVRGLRGPCHIHFEQVVRIVPPSDEEFFQALGASDLAGARSAVRARIQAVKEDEERQRLENALIDKLLESHPMELPMPLVEDQTRARMAELRESLSAQGVVGEEIEERLAAEERRVLAETQRALRALYLMEAIAAKHELQVQQADLLTELRAIAERNGAPLDEVRKYYQEQGLFGQLAMELMERKVRSFLREAADIRLA
jgi:trigger factor